MWIKPETMEVARTHSEVRNILKEVCMPMVMTDEMIESHGMAPVALVAPAYDPATQQATELAPALVDGVWTQQWEVTALPVEQAAAIHQQNVADLIRRIDADVDGIYAVAIGNRGPEYDLAAADAKAYADAGYAGTIPASVQAWATAKAWTAQAAADDILAAAARLAGARDAMRAERLLRKEQARNAADNAALDTITAQWNGFVAALKAQLGVA